MNGNIFWMFEVAIKQGELDNFKALMGEMVALTKAAEPNTLNYEWYISEDEMSCHIYERYADNAALLTHLTSFGKNFASRFTDIATPKRMDVYGNASEEVVAGLQGLGPTYFTPIGGFTR